ncbi:MAG: hypothetical protein V3V11_04410, partial [Vicinamibacteria bacterium]
MPRALHWKQTGVLAEVCNERQRQIGIRGLPETWSVVVQLTGTFGLAVFLVLYYVLFMQPRAQARYDQLTSSVDSLIDVVERGQTV